MSGVKHDNIERLMELTEKLTSSTSCLTPYEEALRDQNQLFETLCETVTDCICVFDTNFRNLISNSACTQMFGVPLSKFSPENGSKMFGLYGPDGKTLIPENDLPVVRAMTGEIVEDFLMYVKNHTLGQDNAKWILVNARPMRDQHNNIIGVVAISRYVKGLCDKDIFNT